MWRESIVDVIRVPEDDTGHIDQLALEAGLAHADRPLRIGSFSAASNVTGLISDVPGLSALLHRYGALACWDYAAAGAHLAIDVGGDRPLGIRTPSSCPRTSSRVARARPASLSCAVTSLATGCQRCPAAALSPMCTVRSSSTSMTSSTARRRTPAIVESIRAGLAFQLKEAVGADIITEIEGNYARRAIASWRTNPAIEILGNPEADRLPIVSFALRGASGRRLHHGFVVALLNDLFGIQCRGGCSCAGPYGHRLLDIGIERARDFAGRAVGAGRHQTRMDPGELQLLLLRAVVPLRPRGGAPRRRVRRTAAPGVPVRPPLGSLEPSRRALRTRPAGFHLPPGRTDRTTQRGPERVGEHLLGEYLSVARRC